MCQGELSTSISRASSSTTCGGGSIGNSGGGDMKCVRHGRSRGGRAVPRLSGGWWPLSCSVLSLLVHLVAAVLAAVSHADLSSSEQQDSSPPDANKGLFIDDSVQDYLRRFGYLQSDSAYPPRTDPASAAAALRTETSVRRALTDLQSFAGIPITGQLDNATMQLLRTPRCGVPDVAGAVDDFNGYQQQQPARRRHKRFMLHGQQWPRRNLTWSLRRVPANLNRNDVRWTLSNALNVWARHSRLTFSEWDSDRADIIINFHRESHGDNFPFDGKGQVLAHAFFPGEGIGGDAHFDEDEIWLTTEPEQENRVGTNLFHVAAHEFGHSLGLQHSHEPQALMYPFYQHNIGNNLEQLPEDDRAGIQALYGTREDTDVWRRMPSVTTPRTTTTTQPTTTSPTPPPPPPMPPRYPKPTYYPRHPTYHTPRRCDPRKPYSKHCKYPPKYPLPPPTSPPTAQPPPRWTTTTSPPYTTRGHTSTSTQSSRRHIGGGSGSNPDGRKGTNVGGRKDKVPDTCNTSYDAISVIRREVFIFKNQYFWRIGEQGLLRGYPVLIERMWHGLPINLTQVDAVYERPDNRIVFFIGKRYYVFIGNQVDPRSAGGHPLTDFGLPTDLLRIDAALVWGHNGRTFLFSGPLYWRLDEDLQRVELDYPRSIEMWRGVGQSIDAAFQWKDGYTYFFKGKGFWRFNDLRMRVDHERQTLSAPFWMGCDVQRLQVADRSAYVNQILPHTAASAHSIVNKFYTEFSITLAVFIVYIYPG